MKKILLFIACLLFCAGTLKAQDPYKLWFSRDGVDVYSWYYDGLGPPQYIDHHVRVKFVNNNTFKVHISWDHFNWEYHGTVVKQHEAQVSDIKPGQQQEGDMAGLWWYPPNNYPMHDLTIRFINFKVEKSTD